MLLSDCISVLTSVVLLREQRYIRVTWEKAFHIRAHLPLQTVPPFFSAVFQPKRRTRRLDNAGEIISYGSFITWHTQWITS